MNEQLIREYIEELKYDELYDYVNHMIHLGNNDALCLMGDMYYYGVGVDDDLEKAIEYYNKAYKKNHLIAKDRLGEIYYNKAEYIYRYATTLFENKEDYFKACAALKYAYATYERSASYGNIKAIRSIKWNFINHKEQLS